MTRVSTQAAAQQALEARRKAEAAAHDERVTRNRVDRLDMFAAQASAVLGGSLWVRLRWLVTGRVKVPAAAAALDTQRAEMRDQGQA